MTIHLMCLTADGGLPIFTRKKGDGENLSFSVIASLNGVHLFCKSQSFYLQSTSTQDGLVVWKEFEGSIVLIIVAPSASEALLLTFLQTVYCTLILHIGSDQLKNIKSVERLKRDLRPCFAVLDQLLETLDSDFIYTECLLCPDPSPLLTALETYSEYLGSPFSCFLVHGRVAVATEAWWALHIVERKLLSIISLLERHDDAARDMPVFLPYKSSNVAFRLVWSSITSAALVLSLCGPTPPLIEIPNLVSNCLQKAQESLVEALSCIPRNFPMHIQLDAGILGILLINQRIGKYMISRSPQQSGLKRSVSGAHRLDVLRAFYLQAVTTAKATRDIDEEVKTEDSKSVEETDTIKSITRDFQTSADVIWDGFESYWCSEYHKCHCLASGQSLLCVLYSSVVPTHTMRIITQRTLKLFLSDKQIYW